MVRALPLRGEHHLPLGAPFDVLTWVLQTGRMASDTVATPSTTSRVHVCLQFTTYASTTSATGFENHRRQCESEPSPVPRYSPTSEGTDRWPR